MTCTKVKTHEATTPLGIRMPLTPSLFPRYPVHPHGKHSRNPVSHACLAGLVSSFRRWCLRQELPGPAPLSRLLRVHGDVRAVVPVPLLAAMAVTAQSCPFCPRTEELAAAGSSFHLPSPPRSTPNATHWECTDAVRPHVEGEGGAGAAQLWAGLPGKPSLQFRCPAHAAQGMWGWKHGLHRDNQG